LRWRHGQPLQITAVEGAVVVHPHPAGVFAVPSNLYVVLPAPVRRRCGLHPGDRVLLAADPEHGVLVVHPLSALDTMITTYHTSLLEGDGDEHTSR
jgi:AbrB family looped-hinge helix DNA binding protein